MQEPDDRVRELRRVVERDVTPPKRPPAETTPG
jgi:hypothetical protein